MFHTDVLYTESPRRGLVLVFRTRRNFVVGADIFGIRELYRLSAVDRRVQDIEFFHHHFFPSFITVVIDIFSDSGENLKTVRTKVKTIVQENVRVTYRFKVLF